MSRQSLLSETLLLIADLVEQAGGCLSEGVASIDVETPQRKGLQLHRRDMMSRIDRRMREKMVPLARNVLRARRERRARSRYQTLKQVSSPPREMFSTRFRKR